MNRPWGVLAEFRTPTAIVKAAAAVHAAGYRKVDAYTPYPMEEVLDALHLHDTHVPKLVLAGGLLGMAAGWGLQYWSSVVEYPMNIGGRPFFAWPAFIVPTFETTVLFAAFAAVFGMLALNGFPQPYHPVFNVPSFVTASRDRFFLCIESKDPKFDEFAERFAAFARRSARKTCKRMLRHAAARARAAAAAEAAAGTKDDGGAHGQGD